MSYISCCNKNRSCVAYRLENIPGVVCNFAFYLEACPACGHTVLVLKRFLPNGEVSIVRKKNEAARKLFDRIRPTILYRVAEGAVERGGKSFLRYNEMGNVKKCYSNLSTLKMGLFDTPGAFLPVIPEKICL